MKIILVSPSLRMGGSERVVSLLTQEWSKDHDVTLVLFNSQEIAYPYHAKLVDLNYPAKKSVFGKISNFFKRIIHLCKLFNEIEPDMIFSFMETANFPTILAALFSRNLSKTNISVHNNPKFFLSSHKIFISLLYRLPPRVIVVSSGIKNAITPYFVPAQKIVCIPNPISLEQISRALNQKQPIDLDLPPQYILAVGRLHIAKGFDRLIQAFAKMNNPEIHLVILGSGDELNNLKDLACALNVYDRTHFLGNVDNPFQVYPKAACLVLSSRYEGFGLVLLEALACNCPIISYDCDYGPSDFIQNGFNGILVKEGDIEALAEAIEELIQNPSLRARLIAHGNETAQQYDIQKIANLYLSIHS